VAAKSAAAASVTINGRVVVDTVVEPVCEVGEPPDVEEQFSEAEGLLLMERAK
jgi:hypothetical protein